jgi:hypothetical protein
LRAGGDIMNGTEFRPIIGLAGILLNMLGTMWDCPLPASQNTPPEMHRLRTFRDRLLRPAHLAGDHIDSSLIIFCLWLLIQLHVPQPPQGREKASKQVRTPVIHDPLLIPLGGTYAE